MRQWETVNDCLNKKMKLLEKIAVNTEIQYRFIHERKMKGLGRIVRQRDVLIGELVAVHEELSKDQGWKNIPGLRPRLQEIAHKQQAIMERSRQVMGEAVAERVWIAAELRSSKARRQVKSQYKNPWAIVARGRLINEKG